MNKAILVGRLTHDPELKVTPNGVNVCSFTVAVGRRFAREGEERQADFIRCVAWQKTAEFICRYFAKGRMIGVVGSIQTRSWDDQEGNRRYATEVRVDEAYFTESKPQSQGLGPNEKLGAGALQEPGLPDGGDFMPGEYEDEDLPF